MGQTKRPLTHTHTHTQASEKGVFNIQGGTHAVHEVHGMVALSTVVLQLVRALAEAFMHRASTTT